MKARQPHGYSSFRAVQVVGDISEAGNGLELNPGSGSAAAELKAVGDHANVGLEIRAKGAGKISLFGDGVVQFAEVTITSAQLLALNATPQTLVAAPGAGRVLQFLRAAVVYDYNSAAYAGIAAGEDLAIRYTNGSGAIVATVETTGFLDQTSDQLRSIAPVNEAAAAITPVANAPLVLHMTSGEITTGNSPLRVKVWYSVFTTDL